MQIEIYVEQTSSSRELLLLLRAKLGRCTPLPERVRNENKGSPIFESVEQIDPETLSDFINEHDENSHILEKLADSSSASLQLRLFN